MSKKIRKIMNKRRLDRISHNNQNTLKRRIKNQLGENVRFASNVQGINMSIVLGKFIEPYMENVSTTDEYKNLLTTAIISWNISLHPKEEHAREITQALKVATPSLRHKGEVIMRELIARKLKYFSNYKRIIADFEIRETGNCWDLSVMSMPESCGDEVSDSE